MPDENLKPSSQPMTRRQFLVTAGAGLVVGAAGAVGIEQVVRPELRPYAWSESGRERAIMLRVQNDLESIGRKSATILDPDNRDKLPEYIKERLARIGFDNIPFFLQGFDSGGKGHGISDFQRVGVDTVGSEANVNYSTFTPMVQAVLAAETIRIANTALNLGVKISPQRTFEQIVEDTFATDPKALLYVYQPSGYPKNRIDSTRFFVVPDRDSLEVNNKDTGSQNKALFFTGISLVNAMTAMDDATGPFNYYHERAATLVDRMSLIPYYLPIPAHPTYSPLYLKPK